MWLITAHRVSPKTGSLACSPLLDAFSPVLVICHPCHRGQDRLSLLLGNGAVLFPLLSLVLPKSLSSFAKSISSVITDWSRPVTTWSLLTVLLGLSLTAWRIHTGRRRDLCREVENFPLSEKLYGVKKGTSAIHGICLVWFEWSRIRACDVALYPPEECPNNL